MTHATADAVRPPHPALSTMSDLPIAGWREHALAPAPGTELCALDAVPDGGAKELVFGAGREPFRMLLLRSGDRVHGYVNRCPHFGVPLNVQPDRFTLFAHSHIYCSVHYAMFRFEDGHCEDGPCTGDHLTPVPLTCEDGRVRIARP